MDTPHVECRQVWNSFACGQQTHFLLNFCRAPACSQAPPVQIFPCLFYVLFSFGWLGCAPALSFGLFNSVYNRCNCPAGMYTAENKWNHTRFSVETQNCPAGTLENKWKRSAGSHWESRESDWDSRESDWESMTWGISVREKKLSLRSARQGARAWCLQRDDERPGLWETPDSGKGQTLRGPKRNQMSLKVSVKA